MKDTFQARFSTPRSAQDVLDELLQVDRVVSWFPILTDVQEISHLERYSAILEDQLGAFRMRADMSIRIAVQDRVVSVSAEGRDRQVGSRLAVEGALAVLAMDNGCEVTIDAEYQVSGKAASLGARSIRTKATHLFEGFCERLVEEILTVPTEATNESSFETERKASDEHC